MNTQTQPAARFWRAVCALTLLCAAALTAIAQERSIVLASTTSTEQSGLFAHLLPSFTQASGIQVKVVALGTGQALDVARRGDADVVFVHDAAAELKFMAEGHGLARRAVMHNDFVLLGPKDDPAGVAGADLTMAMKKLAQGSGQFISRGDKSGTHSAELRAWADAGLDVTSLKASSYKACGCGMGAALNMASSLDAYTLSDRGTWISFKNKGNLAVLVQGDPRLFNPYTVMLVNPAKHPHVKHQWAQEFADWLVSKEGQARIASFKIGGEALFFPDAVK